MLRGVLRNIVLSNLGRFKSVSSGIHILNGHYISRDLISERPFRALIRDILDNADLINIEEAAMLVKSGEAGNINQKLVAFTFDDGFEECYHQIAPILVDNNVNAAFFINPNFHEGIDKYNKEMIRSRLSGVPKIPMTKLMIKSLASEGFEIGSHTTDHFRLSLLDRNKLLEQIVNCKKKVEHISGKECSHFAWPYGTYSDVSPLALDLMTQTYEYVYSSCSSGYYTSHNSTVINRRHFEGDWPISHLRYFLSPIKKQNINVEI